MKIPLRYQAIGLIILCTAFTSVAQLLLKTGSQTLAFDFFQLITNYYLLAGLASYGLGALLLIKSLKWGELTLLYPLVATSYIWVSLLSIFFLNETMNFYKWLGVAIILLGVVVIASKKEGTLIIKSNPEEVVNYGH